MKYYEDESALYELEVEPCQAMPAAHELTESHAAINASPPPSVSLGIVESMAMPTPTPILKPSRIKEGAGVVSSTFGASTLPYTPSGAAWVQTQAALAEQRAGVSPLPRTSSVWRWNPASASPYSQSAQNT